MLYYNISMTQILSMTPQSGAKPKNHAADDLIAMDGAHIHFDKRCVLHAMNLRIQRQSMVAIMGPNGAGKTSLLRAIVGILPVTTGSIAIAGRQKLTIGYLPQISDFDRDFPLRVSELVGMGLMKKKLAKTARKEIVDNALADVQLSDYADSFIQDLSAGQLKRAFLARILAQDADIFCLDEPFAELDQSSTAQIMSLLKRAQARGKTILVVIHDPALLNQGFDQILRISNQTATLDINPHTYPQSALRGYKHAEPA